MVSQVSSKGGPPLMLEGGEYENHLAELRALIALRIETFFNISAHPVKYGTTVGGVSPHSVLQTLAKLKN